MQQICPICETLFTAKKSEIKRGGGKFCSRKCSGVNHSIKLKQLHEKKPNNVACALCNIAFFISSSKQRNSKSGLFFCCRAHKDAAQRIGGIREIMPPHYGTASQADSLFYRKLAFAAYPAKCVICGYDKYKSVLEVHHKDCNHQNNAIDNLEIRCPTHHVEWHYETSTGRYGRKQAPEVEGWNL